MASALTAGLRAANPAAAVAVRDLTLTPQPVLGEAALGALFTPAEKGPVGLLTGKKVYVVTSRGGIHRDPPSDQMTPYLRTVLAFLGMTDVELVYAEGMAFAAEQGLAAARSQINQLLAA